MAIHVFLFLYKPCYISNFKKTRQKVKHALEPTRLRMASWNIGTMTGKSLEIEEMMLRRRLDVLSVRETKWKNTACRARFLDPKTRSHKFFYYGTEQGKNGVGIILKAELTSGIISITKPSDRLISIKLVINKEIWYIISPYTQSQICTSTCCFLCCSI